MILLRDSRLPASSNSVGDSASGNGNGIGNGQGNGNAVGNANGSLNGSGVGIGNANSNISIGFPGHRCRFTPVTRLRTIAVRLGANSDGSYLDVMASFAKPSDSSLLGSLIASVVPTNDFLCWFLGIVAASCRRAGDWARFNHVVGFLVSRVLQFSGESKEFTNTSFGIAKAVDALLTPGAISNLSFGGRQIHPVDAEFGLSVIRRAVSSC